MAILSEDLCFGSDARDGRRMSHSAVQSSGEAWTCCQLVRMVSVPHTCCKPLAMPTAFNWILQMGTKGTNVLGLMFGCVRKLPFPVLPCTFP